MSIKATKDGPKRQITFWVSAEDYRLVITEAGRRNVPMNTIMREWMQPHLRRLKKKK